MAWLRHSFRGLFHSTNTSQLISSLYPIAPFAPLLPAPGLTALGAERTWGISGCGQTGDRQRISGKRRRKLMSVPSYIDDKAGSQNVLPLINISGMAYYASSGHAAAPGLTQRGTTEQLAPKMTTIKGNHTFKYGLEIRRYQYASVTAGGNPSGNFAFNNTYVRQADNTASTATTNTGLGYASYLMALPNSVSLTTNDTGFWSTPYQAVYFQDDFRLTPKLRLGFGVRFEHEGGNTERFNRGLEGQYDFSYAPPYASAVQGAYASLLSNPANANNAAVQTLAAAVPAGQFNLNGGVQYLGQKDGNFTQGTKRFLPNVSLVYQLTP